MEVPQKGEETILEKNRKRVNFGNPTLGNFATLSISVSACIWIFKKMKKMR